MITEQGLQEERREANLYKKYWITMMHVARIIELKSMGLAC